VTLDITNATAACPVTNVIKVGSAVTIFMIICIKEFFSVPNHIFNPEC
jgi:hypothetical protein